MGTLAPLILLGGGMFLTPLAFIFFALKNSKRSFRYSYRALFTFIIGCSLWLTCCVKTSQNDTLYMLGLFLLGLVWCVAGIVSISWSAITKEGCEIGGVDVITRSFLGVYSAFCVMILLTLPCYIVSRILSF
jgi:hypothetical protein